MRLLISLAISLLSSIGWTADFGESNWGDTRDTVLSAETRINVTPVGQFDYLVYQTKVIALSPVLMVYHFTDDKLSKGVFIFPTENFPTEVLMTHYQSIGEMVAAKYGPAETDDELWAMPPAETNRSLWPEMLEKNQLILQREWINQTTRIRQQLSESDEAMHHQLVYTPADMTTHFDSPF